MLHTETSGLKAVTSPLAYRMMAIAFLNQNIAIACIWGSFSVLLLSVESRLGVGRQLSTLGAPAVNLSCAITAPFVGILAARYSLKLIMMTGSILGVAGFLLLALGHSIVLYLAAYGVLLGPAMAVSVILPATLVTRWFTTNAGRALGIMTTQLFVGFIPLTTNWIVHAYGLPATYIALAGLSAVGVIANLFVIDHPPGAVQPVDPVRTAHGANAPAAHGADAPTAHGANAPADADTGTMGELLSQPALWGIALAFIACSAATIILLAHMVPLARSWGFPSRQAALLLSIQSLAGLAGTILCGWIADKLGGARTMAILTFDAVILWSLLLWHPSFAATAAIIGVWGLHSSGTVPVISLALSQTFGKASFSRAYGLVQLIALPFSVLCVPAASLVFTRTGSYSGAILGVVVFLAITCLLPLVAVKRKVKEAAF